MVPVAPVAPAVPVAPAYLTNGAWIAQNPMTGVYSIAFDSPGVSGRTTAVRIHDNLFTGITTKLGGNGWGILIGHGPRPVGDGVGKVDIAYELLPDRLVIEVTDEGGGFDAAKTRNSPGDLYEGGLGIAIIRAIADVVEFGAQANGKGSRLRFEKALN